MAPRMKATDRRRQLLEASIKCFADHGYQGTTTARLAKAAGVSEPVLYQHFASKHDLFVALLEQVGKEVLREWRKAIAPLKMPIDQLRVLLRLNPALTDPRTQPATESARVASWTPAGGQESSVSPKSRHSRIQEQRTQGHETRFSTFCGI